MSAKMRLTMASMMVLFVFILSAVMTVPALADDETPPADAPVVTEPDIVDETVSVPLPDPSPAPAEEAESTPVEETAAEAELLSDLPQGTEVIVLNQEGETVPLVTEEAAEIIAVADPMWCPAGVTPGAATCSISYTNLKQLFDDFMDGPLGLTAFAPAGNGVIWITGYVTSGFAADSSAAAIVLNGTDLDVALIKDFSLTLKGGWTGTGTTINTADASVFNRTISILNWGGDVTLNDIVITAAPGGDGLTVGTTKNIVLTRVTSQNNPAGRGAQLDNSGGTGNITVTTGTFNGNTGFSGITAISSGVVTLTSVIATGNSGHGFFLNNSPGTANVMISASQFNGNGGATGLRVLSRGQITLTNVTASGNNGGGSTGAFLNNSTALTAKGVTLTGVNTFDDNTVTGLSVQSKGAITANDISANRNGGGYGALLTNNTASTPQPVTLTGTNIFTENFFSGLYINSLGAVKLNNVNANANTTASGVEISNSGGTAQPVTLTGTNSFKFNDDYGLYIDSKGLITLNNITANSNATAAGASLINSYATFSSGVTLTGTNHFNDNYSSGLYVNSFGAISAANLNANGNGTGGSGYGANLTNSGASTPKNVTLSGTNTFDDNNSGGLNVNSKGAITANNLNASRNTNGYGASLINNTAAAPQAVKVTGTNLLLNNYWEGLYVYSVGAISVNSVTASGNGLSLSGHGIYLYNADPLAVGGITMTGTNAALNNDDSGLYAISKGTITVKSLTATGNGVNGAYLSNTAGTTAGVTVTGTNKFDDNQDQGLVIYSRGTVTLSNINSSGSVSDSGLIVDNTFSGAPTPRNITLSGVNVFNNNDGSGIELASYGTITLSNITASGNGFTTGYGAYISNASGTIAKDVVLTGTNTFNNNFSAGLLVYSRGAIKVSNLKASNNDGGGASLSNTYGTAFAGVTLTGFNSFNDNAGTGLNVQSYGTVAASNLTANGNGTSGIGYGVSITNIGGSTAKTVTLTGVNTFDGNKTMGLYVYSWGAITASNLSASNTSSGMGVYLANNAGGSTAGVTLSGVSVFNNNFSTGLSVVSYGAISLNTTSLTAKWNGVGAGAGHGVNLMNSGAATPKAVTLKGTSTLLANFSGGLNVNSTGAITASNLNASETTTGFGANLANTTAGAVGGITLTGTNAFNSNSQDGLLVYSLGAISVNSLTANSNGVGYGGVSLINDGAATPQFVKLTGTNAFNYNNTYGLFVSSIGAITANSVTVNNTANGTGADFNNMNPGGVGGVTLTGTNVFNNNYYHGLSVFSFGAVTLNSATANDNGANPGLPFGYGVWIDNDAAATAQAVKLTGTNTFNGNYDGGLLVVSKGTISANNLTASDTLNGFGAQLTNTAGAADVTLTGKNNFIGNNTTGLSITSLGNVNLTRVTADDNTWNGVYVSTSGNVTLTCGSLTYNGLYGVNVSTPATLKLIGVFSSGNAIGNTNLAGGGTLVVTRNCPLP